MTSAKPSARVRIVNKICEVDFIGEVALYALATPQAFVHSPPRQGKPIKRWGRKASGLRVRPTSRN